MEHTIAVYDIDGTLADDALKDIMDSEAYYAPKVLRKLPPIKHMVALAKSMGEDENVHVIIITGRLRDRDNGATQAWLDNYNIKHDEILLRPDNIPHSDVAMWKRQALRSYLKNNFMPDKSPDFSTDEGLKTVMVWEDTVANLIEFQSLLLPTGFYFTLFEVQAKTHGHQVKVWDRRVSQNQKPFVPIENELEHEIINMEDVGSNNTFFEDGGNMV